MADAERDYRERYVAFVDVLGFSELVRDADAQPYRREAILTVIASLRTTLTMINPSGFRFTQFSDCIVISADRSRDGLLAIFTGCTALVTDLLQQGVLLRGGVVVGNLVHTNEILFGTGLLKAYAYDVSGGNPRILLDENVIDDAMREGLEELVVADHSDTTRMLHTFWDFENFDSSALMPATIRVAAHKISQNIARTCEDSTKPSDVVAKWQWVRRYWNGAAANGFLRHS